MARKKQKSPEEIKQDITRDFEQEYARWHDLYENGGSDPFWEDGVNLNLVRNHIIYARRRCEELLGPLPYPSLYYADLPPEVDNHYMAKADEIRRQSRDVLNECQENADYQFLMSVSQRPDIVSEAIQKSLQFLRYVRSLETAIDTDRLVDMRRYIHWDFPKEFAKSRTQVENLLNRNSLKTDESGQMSFFI